MYNFFCLFLCVFAFLCRLVFCLLSVCCLGLSLPLPSLLKTSKRSRAYNFWGLLLFFVVDRGNFGGSFVLEGELMQL